jgi:chemotaxis protein MotB
MAGDAKKLQPIIIKRVKKGGHAAHGGAWKIAYADFVTAMMAFFLLMWLLGSTTEGDKKGIADYFGSPLRISLLGGGSGSGDSSHVIQGGGQDLTRTTGQVKRGDIESTRATVNLRALKAEQVRAEIARLEDLQRRVEQKLAGNQRLAAMSSQIRLDMTHEGLRIQIIDAENRPMFASGSAVVQPYMRELLREIGSVLGEVPNRLTLEGHTDALPFSGGERGYSNWELSTERANASRRELVAGGLPEDRMLRVQGLAASRPLDRRDRYAPANRRISIIVMNREAENRAIFDLDPAAPGTPMETSAFGGDEGITDPAGGALRPAADDSSPEAGNR